MTALLADLYALNMVQAYLDAGMTGRAVFEFYVRKLPPARGFFIVAGLQQVVEALEDLTPTPEEMDWLKQGRRFKDNLLSYMEGLRFTGDLHAMPEGTAFFPDEPVLRVTAPLPEAQLVEARLMNLVHFQSLVASKAARMVLAARGRTLIDFGLRRTHGSEAGILAARAAYIAGFDATATVAAGMLFGIPTAGTMAHSFIQAHDDEAEAFIAFARSRPDNVVLLLDTYDTEAAARKVVALAPRLAEEGIRIRGVRLDSGDLAQHARRVRAILDAGGLAEVRILASGGLDESKILAFAGAPIDGFGIGGSLGISTDAPVLDAAYKLQEYAGKARRKHSEGKATWPGTKQVWRHYKADGSMDHDVLTVEDDPAVAGEPLLIEIMRDGRRTVELPALEQTRIHAGAQLARLPAHLRRLSTKPAYRVEVAPALLVLADEVDRRLGGGVGTVT